MRANVSTNLPSPVFEGFRAYRDWGFARLDAFAFNLAKFQDGIFNARDVPHINLWGVYGCVLIWPTTTGASYANAAAGCTTLPLSA